jgi:hypothetical protein
MTFDEMTAIVAAISYKPGWRVCLRRDAGRRPFLQLEVSAEAAAALDSQKRDGSRTPWKSGKRYLSKHMCRREVVGAAFGLIRDAEEHEMREWFRYCDAAIFNPHLDPQALVAVANRAASFNLRADPMGMAEA